jgi:acyl carrier protein
MGLDTVELVLEAEKQFGVAIPDERAAKTITVEQFAQLIFELRAETKSPLPYAAVLSTLRQIVARQFDIPIEHVTPAARFVQDLGLE